MAVSCGVGLRCGLDLMLLWLWCRPAAVALIGPLAWESPCSTGVALESGEKKKKSCCSSDSTTSICHRCCPKKKQKKESRGLMMTYRLPTDQK